VSGDLFVARGQPQQADNLAELGSLAELRIV